MAHGWRERVALLGAGLFWCAGLTGCLENDRKPYSAPPTAKGTQSPFGGAPKAGSPTAWGSSTTGAGTAGAGLQPANNTSAGRTPSNGFMDPNYLNVKPGAPGVIGGQAVPGPAGFGAPIPGVNSLVPPTAPPGWTSSNESRTAVPSTTASRSGFNPPPMGFDVAFPPSPPAAMPAQYGAPVVQPPTPAVGSLPLAPTAPNM